MKKWRHGERERESAGYHRIERDMERCEEEEIWREREREGWRCRERERET